MVIISASNISVMPEPQIIVLHQQKAEILMLLVDTADLITGYSDLENKTGAFRTMLTDKEDTGTWQRWESSWPALQFVEVSSKL